MAEWSGRIASIFVTGSSATKNKIYGVRMFIRGKPYVIAIDDTLLFANSSVDGSLSLVFAGMGNNNTAFWAPLLEKAWIKITGNS